MSLDYAFITLLIVLVTLIILIFYGNNSRKTSDLKEIMTRLMLEDPTTVAFSLGWDSARKSYRNVYVDDQTSDVNVKWETYPVNQQGKFIVPSGQGKVSEREDKNGFVVTGMELVDFICPPGFTDDATTEEKKNIRRDGSGGGGGGNCLMKPVCEPGAGEHLQPLTYTQFNALNLYKNDFKSIVIPPPKVKSLDDDDDDEPEPIHSRIRVLCHVDGTYELETCEENRLIDPETLNCRVYDLCEDRLSGYKHNLPIDDTSPPLADDEYYLCSDNRSVKQKCAVGTVFSRANQGCIVESKCFGKGDAQLSVDDTHYIQCRADTGRIVNCANGVLETDDGHGGKTLSCRTDLCKPKSLHFDDGLLAFDYGAVICVPPEGVKDPDPRDYVPKTIECDRTSAARIVYGRWIDQFELIRFDNWPKETYDSTTKTCVPLAPDDESEVVKADVRRSIAWSLLMNDAHDYDIKTRSYICDGATTRYQWDYTNGRMMPPNVTDEDLAAGRTFVDTASPCQSGARRPVDLPWQGTAVVSIPTPSMTQRQQQRERQQQKKKKNNNKKKRDDNDELPMPPIAGLYFGLTDVNKWSDPKNPLVNALDVDTRRVFDRTEYTWPCYDSSAQTYFASLIRFDVENRQLVIERCVDKLPPIGYARFDEATIDAHPLLRVSETVSRLRLLGADSFVDDIISGPKMDWDELLYYVVASGVTAALTFSPDVRRETVTFACPVRVDTRDVADGEARLFFLLWPNIKSADERYEILSDDRLVVTSQGVQSNDRIEESCYKALYMAKTSSATDPGTGNVTEWTFRFIYGTIDISTKSATDLSFVLP